jgi:hypothetical protein
MHIFVHVLDVNGTLATQHDSPPLLGLMPFWQWQAGDRVRDVHPIDLPDAQTGAPYSIVVGLYDAATGERLPPALSDGSRPPNDAISLGTIGPDSTHRCPELQKGGD